MSTKFTRIATHARKRSKRKDFPPLEGRSLFYFEVRSLILVALRARWRVVAVVRSSPLLEQGGRRALSGRQG